jgi:type II secretory pathway pseudopilin PulG
MSATGEAGMTLIEALVVLAITALVSSLIFPRLGSLQAQGRFRAAVAEVTAGLQRQAATAVLSHSPRRAQVSRDGRSLLLSDAEPVSLPDGVQLRQITPGAVVFGADGSASSGRWLVSDQRQHHEIRLDGGLVPRWSQVRP